MLEHIDLLAQPNPELTQLVNSLDRRGNPMQDTQRVHDLDTLASSSKLVECPRLCIASDNALLLYMLQHLPDTVSEIRLAREDSIKPLLRVLPELEKITKTGTTNPDDFETTLVVDVMDVFIHADQIQRELRSGRVRQVWVHCTLLSYARTWLNTVGEDVFEHFPFSRGFAGAMLDRAQCIKLADGLDACAQESRWYPARVNQGIAKSSKLDPSSILSLAKTIGGARSDDEFLLCGLSKRAAHMIEDISDAIAVALPHIEMGPPPMSISWKNKWKVDALASAELTRSYFQDHPRSDLIRVMIAENFDTVLDLADQVIDLHNKTQIVGTLKAMSKLLGMLYQIREQIWWMRDWDAANNQTWKILTQNECPVGTLGPKPVRPLIEYLNWYWYRGARSAERMSRNASKRAQDAFNERPAYRRINSINHLNHTTRKLQASNLCSMLLNRLGAQFPDETIRWLDVGCGNGEITNSFQIPDWLEDRVEIIGLDFGEGMIKFANEHAASNRRYMVANALTPPDEIMGMRFHMISTFEFLEHLIDPVELLRNYATLKPEIMVGGSPLGEPQPWLPAREHTWSFKREGYEALFKAAGMKITYSSEVRIGSYLGGHDWLTVAGAFGQGILQEIPRETVAQLTKHERFEEYKSAPSERVLG